MVHGGRGAEHLHQFGQRRRWCRRRLPRRAGLVEERARFAQGLPDLVVQGEKARRCCSEWVDDTGDISAFLTLFQTTIRTRAVYQSGSDRQPGRRFRRRRAVAPSDAWFRWPAHCRGSMQLLGDIAGMLGGETRESRGDAVPAMPLWQAAHSWPVCRAKLGRARALSRGRRARHKPIAATKAVTLVIAMAPHHSVDNRNQRMKYKSRRRQRFDPDHTFAYIAPALETMLDGSEPGP